MKLTVNGVAREVGGSELRPLLHVLREDLDITGPKAGCQQGSCGTCTVLVDGEPRRSCLLPLAAADGAEITTVEGLGDARRLHALQASFHHYYGTQCGFCTPGFAVATYAALQRYPTANQVQLRWELVGHLCRCNAYDKIMAAVQAVSQQRPGAS